MERHTVVGEQILAPVEFLAGVCKLVRHEHERWDGARLSRRPRRRGDPARLAHHPRLRRAPRDDLGPPVPRALPRRGRPRGAAPPRRHAVRSDGRRRAARRGRRGAAPGRHRAVRIRVYSRSMFLFREKAKMIDPERALPGRDTPLPVPARHDVLGTPLAPPFPEQMEQLVARARLLLGRGAAVLEAPRRLHDRGRLRGRLHAEPDLRGGLQRLDRPHRGGAGRVRPGEGLARRDPAHLLGGPRPDAGHAPGQRRRHAVPLGDLLRLRRAARRDRGVARALPGVADRRRARRDHHRDRPGRARSTTPRATTSSTSTRTRTATAGWAARASPARSGSARRPSSAERRSRAPSGYARRSGGVAEWSNAAVLKTVGPVNPGPVGSNPTPSAHPRQADVARRRCSTPTGVPPVTAESPVKRASKRQRREAGQRCRRAQPVRAGRAPVDVRLEVRRRDAPAEGRARRASGGGRRRCPRSPA